MPREHTANGISLDIIRLAQTGDRAAFAELVRMSRRRVLGTIGRLIARPEDAEDVGQEVFLRMHASIGRLQSAEAFDLWLWRLTTNATYDYLRKRPRTRREVRISDLLDGQVNAAANSVSCQLEREERDRRRTIEYVDSLLAQLSPNDRILIVMREVEGLSMEELAAVLGIKVGAVKLRLFRARNRLRQVLKPEQVRPRRVAPATAVAAQQA
jgi:RNA polymerase sigma-70 factor (ECF subfamily)